VKKYNKTYNKSIITDIFLSVALIIVTQFGAHAQNTKVEHTHTKTNNQHYNDENNCPKCKDLGYEKCQHNSFDVKDVKDLIPPILYVDPTDPNSNNTCNKFLPFCGDGVMKFETTSCPNHPQNSTATCSICSGQGGFTYGCLTTYPRPAWFCMKVDVAGQVVIHVESSIHNDDIDIAIWGPFDSPTEACANYFYGQSPIACSYSSYSFETMTIPSAVAGKYYMMVITNYQNYLATVDITMTNAGQPGAGQLSCDIVYECSMLSISTNTSVDSCSSSYSVYGVIDFTNAPDTSRLCVVNTALLPNDTFYINPPFSALSEYAYFFNGVPFDSVSPKVIAWFETDTACYKEQSYSVPSKPAPQLEASGGGAICIGDSVMVKFRLRYSCDSATFSYSINDTTIITVTDYSGFEYIIWAKESAVYKPLSISNHVFPSGTISGTVTVTVNPRPIITTQNAAICSGSHTFNCGLSGNTYKYEWKNLATSTVVATTSTFTTSTAGKYQISVKYNSTLCESLDTVELIVFGKPIVTLSASSTSICPGDSVFITALSTHDSITNYEFFRNGTSVQNGIQTIYREGNFMSAATYIAIATCTNDTLVCVGDSSAAITINLVNIDAPVLIIPNDTILYVNSVCFADTTTLSTGFANIEYDTCIRNTNTNITYIDSVYTQNGTTIIKRKWTGTHLSTNQQTTLIQTITLSDTIKPTFVTPNDTVVYKDNDCNYIVDTIITGDITNVADNCTAFANLLISYSDSISDTLILRTWTVIDESGNTVNDIQRIILDDTIAPEIIVNVSDLNLECDGNGNIDEINEWLTDNGNGQARDCSPEIIWENNYSENNFTIDANCIGTKYQTVTFTITDAKGNFTTRNAEITIKDTQKPYFVTYPSNLVLRCDDDSVSAKITNWLAINGGFSANDICNADAITYSNNYAALNFDTTSNCTIEKIATVSFMATDVCGNILSITAKIQIKPARKNVIIAKNHERIYGDTIFMLQAVSTSTLPVELNIIGGTSVNIEKISDGYYLAKIEHAGTTTIEATQLGDDSTLTAIPETFDIEIIPARLTISLEDKMIKQGDEIPEFTIIYKGFVYGETEAVLITQPIVYCIATMNSAPGKYTINAFSASAENYVIEYQSATLDILVNFPNAFTPYTQDNLNDIFAEGHNVKIFNRNGQLMYEGNNGWDGTHKQTGKLANPGVYYYVILWDNNVYRGSIMLVK
jgi:hypothetical protein